MPAIPALLALHQQMDQVVFIAGMVDPGDKHQLPAHDPFGDIFIFRHVVPANRQLQPLFTGAAGAWRRAPPGRGFRRPSGSWLLLRDRISGGLAFTQASQRDIGQRGHANANQRGDPRRQVSHHRAHGVGAQPPAS
ncbi:Uncharacterised protein [Klebsiella grimontii]|uniref:Uncharacterized protein n=1 Tax=Klebsiella grimontii TaxID=2058152 RepID=A0A7H4P813_9ENTR|nr:Uncharacterised protein [Klebsiella grimontii]